MIINEMAYTRKDAIDKCLDLQKPFVKHFKKILLDKNIETIKHHAKKMQTWFDKAASIKLVTTNAPLNSHHLWDWFVEGLGTCIDLFDNEDDANLYCSFCDDLLDTYNVLESLKNLNIIKD